MAVGQVSKIPTNIPGVNSHTNNVLNEPPPAYRVARNIPKTSSVYNYTSQAKEEAPPAEDTSSEATDTSEATASEKKSSSNSKREEWSALIEAQKLKKEAEDLFKKAEQFKSVKTSNTKLQAMADALGVPASDLLLQMQNEAMALPTTKPLTKEEQTAMEAKMYREAIEKARNDTGQMYAETAKLYYINREILPTLIKNPSDFEFCHEYGLDKCAREVYDFCNKHHMDHNFNGEGEDLNPVEVLKQFEQKLEDMWVKELETGKKLKKTQKYLSPYKKEATKKETKADPDQVLGATEETKTEAEAIVNQLVQEGNAKRVGPPKRTDKTDAKAADLQRAASNANKLSSNINPKADFNKERRKARIFSEE